MTWHQWYMQRPQQRAGSDLREQLESSCSPGVSCMPPVLAPAVPQPSVLSARGRLGWLWQARSRRGRDSEAKRSKEADKNKREIGKPATVPIGQQGPEPQPELHVYSHQPATCTPSSPQREGRIAIAWITQPMEQSTMAKQLASLKSFSGQMPAGV